MSSTKRIGYIDIAKGIAFIFIVVGHVGLVFSSDAVQGGMPPYSSDSRSPSTSPRSLS